MGKKKNKVARITEEQYYAYIAGLKDDAALFDANGDMLIPSVFRNVQLAENLVEPFIKRRASSESLEFCEFTSVFCKKKPFKRLF